MSDVNVIVLKTFDNDNDPVTPFGAGNAASLIANQVTSSGPDFFIYFNQGLDLPRLVYSTDLDTNTADLRILTRMTNLAGNPGTLAGFTSANFQVRTRTLECRACVDHWRPLGLLARGATEARRWAVK